MQVGGTLHELIEDQTEKKRIGAFEAPAQVLPAASAKSDPPRISREPGVFGAGATLAPTTRCVVEAADGKTNLMGVREAVAVRTLLLDPIFGMGDQGTALATAKPRLVGRRVLLRIPYELLDTPHAELIQKLAGWVLWQQGTRNLQATAQGRAKYW